MIILVNLNWDNISSRTCTDAHCIVSIWKALTKQAWQLLPTQNSVRLRGWAASRVTLPSLSTLLRVESRTRSHRWQTASRLLRQSRGRPVGMCTFKNTDVNPECQEKATCSKSSLSPCGELNAVKTSDDKTALSRIISHVMDECLHHFRMDISAGAVPQVPAKVPPSHLSHQTKSFSMSYNSTPSLSGEEEGSVST